MKVTTFRELKVWQKAHELVLEVYKITKNFPKEERFGLVSQIRRSASSIATNIVEGNKRKSRKEYLYFLNIADSSLEETKYHILLSKDLGYIDDKEFNNLTGMSDEVGKMLFGLQRSLTT
ncbi:MAG: four helix bundle protein [Candidatus Omnitrophota bacterium]